MSDRKVIRETYLEITAYGLKTALSFGFWTVLNNREIDENNITAFDKDDNEVRVSKLLLKIKDPKPVKPKKG